MEKNQFDLQVINFKFREGLEKELYGYPYEKRLLQYAPKIIEVNQYDFKFGMCKHYGIFTAKISQKMRRHWFQL